MHPSGESRKGAVASGGRLRDGRLADLPALCALEARFPGDRLSSRQFRHHLASPRARLRVLVDDAGAIAGYALLLLHSARPAARLYSVVVDPARRGQGLGRRLLADAEAQARAAARSAISLEVRADNPVAIALYRRRGYHERGRRPGYYEDGMDALCMRLDLAAGAGP